MPDIRYSEKVTTLMYRFLNVFVGILLKYNFQQPPFSQFQNILFDL